MGGGPLGGLTAQTYSTGDLIFPCLHVLPNAAVQINSQVELFNVFLYDNSEKEYERLQLKEISVNGLGFTNSNLP